MTPLQDDASVLITGAQGFIGAWLAERLLDAGARVVVPRHEPRPGSRFLRQGLEQRCDVVELDLLDLASVLRVLNEHKVSCVYHLAAQTLVGTADRAPLATFRANVGGTYTLLEAARLLEAPPRVVVASSSYAYGEQGEAPYSEGLSLRPTRPYDVSKACCDMVARSYAATHGMPVAVVRLTNVYGGGDLNFSRLIPATARALLRGERPVIASDGTPERDYVYVEDAVSAYLAVAESLRRSEHFGRSWNAGGDEVVSMASLVRRLIALSGREVDPEIRGLPAASNGIDRRYVDSRAIREGLGWAPSWDLDQGLSATLGWYERNLT